MISKGLFSHLIDNGYWQVRRKVLVDKEFEIELKVKSDELTIGPNSVDVTLGYEFIIPPGHVSSQTIDRETRSVAHVVTPHPVPRGVEVRSLSLQEPAREEDYDRIIVRHGDSITLMPGAFVLGVAREGIQCSKKVDLIELNGQVHNLNLPLMVPRYNGRSTMARMGVLSHVSAGEGDYGFGDTGDAFTLELTVLGNQPVTLYPEERIGQIYMEPMYTLPGEHVDKYDRYGGMSPQIPNTGEGRG